VRAKFNRDDYLSERLGRAISARRRYLTYREEHHRKLSKNVEKIGYEEPKTIVTTNSTEATRLDGAEKYTLDEDDEEILSQTSYAASENAALRVPGLPREARNQEHFECPLCYMIVSIRTQAAWKYVNSKLIFLQ
jgi:hypothetical protein